MINVNSKKYVDDLILLFIILIKYIFDNINAVEFVNNPFRPESLLHLWKGRLSILLSSYSVGFGDNASNRTLCLILIILKMLIKFDDNFQMWLQQWHLFVDSKGIFNTDYVFDLH